MPQLPADSSRRPETLSLRYEFGNFGCVLDGLTGGVRGAFFNVSLHALRDEQHRGDAYLGLLSTKALDVSRAAGACRDSTPIRRPSRWRAVRRGYARIF